MKEPTDEKEMERLCSELNEQNGCSHIENGSNDTDSQNERGQILKEFCLFACCVSCTKKIETDTRQIIHS